MEKTVLERQWAVTCASEVLGDELWCSGYGDSRFFSFFMLEYFLKYVSKSPAARYYKRYTSWSKQRLLKSQLLWFYHKFWCSRQSLLWLGQSTKMNLNRKCNCMYGTLCTGVQPEVILRWFYTNRATLWCMDDLNKPTTHRCAISLPQYCENGLILKPLHEAGRLTCECWWEITFKMSKLWSCSTPLSLKTTLQRDGSDYDASIMNECEKSEAVISGIPLSLCCFPLQAGNLNL